MRGTEDRFFPEYEEEALQIAGKGQTPMFVASGGKVIGL